MGFKALTVNTAVEAAGHIYAEDDAAIFQSMFGGDGVLNIGNCLKSTVISNNKVRISDGVLSVGGHIGRLSHADYQDMTIENGATGYNRNDIIYARFLTSGNVDSFILAVKKGTATTGTATDPALVQGNLYEGAVERDYPLYRVKLSGLSISSVDQLFTVIPTIPDLKAQMEKDKAEINQSLTNIKYVTDVNSFVNSGSAFVYSETGNKITIYCYGSVKSDLPLNAILCSGFPAPLFAYSALHIINLTTGEIGSCTIRQNGQLLILNNILKAGHAFCISGVYIKA